MSGRKTIFPSTIICIILFAILMITYIGGMVFFSTHFMPATLLNGQDIGMSSRAEVLMANENLRRDFNITLIDFDGRKTVVSDKDFDILFKLDEKSSLKKTDYFSVLSWPIDLLNTHVLHVEHKISYDKSKIESKLDDCMDFVKQGQLMEAYQYIEPYNDETGSFSLASINPTTVLDRERLLNVIYKRLNEVKLHNLSDIDINLSEEGCYITEEVSDLTEKSREILDTANKYVSTRVKYNWNGNEFELDGDTIKDWVIVDDTGVRLDEDKLSDFVRNMAEKYDTYGKKSEFITHDGRTKVLKRNAYGFRTNTKREVNALSNIIEQGLTVNREPETSARGFVQGENDIGRSYVEVDMTAQRLFLWVDGSVVMESPVVTGDMMTDCASPEGIFGIKYKKADVVLRGPTWEDPVSYWMPYFESYGIHDATWRDTFGGDIYTYSGSHGCVNMPLDTAGVVYMTVSRNFPVICYY